MAYGTIAGDFAKHYFTAPDKKMSIGNLIIGGILIAICIGAIILVIFL